MFFWVIVLAAVFIPLGWLTLLYWLSKRFPKRFGFLQRKGENTGL